MRGYGKYYFGSINISYFLFSARVHYLLFFKILKQSIYYCPSIKNISFCSARFHYLLFFKMLKQSIQYSGSTILNIFPFHFSSGSLSKTYQPMDKDLACDIHIINLRTMMKSSSTLKPSNNVALILHRQVFFYF